MFKRGITIPRDYQERIAAYIEQMGNRAFTTRDCVDEINATKGSVDEADIPNFSVSSSLNRRYERGELDRIRVGRAYLYTKEDDARVMKEPPGLVAKLLWSVLANAAEAKPTGWTAPEIAAEIERQHPKHHYSGKLLSCDLLRWYQAGHLHRNGRRGQYRYCLTEVARQLTGRPALRRQSNPRTEPVQEPHVV